MKLSLRLVVVVAVPLILSGLAVWFFVFRSGETGPVSVEAVSDDGFLRLTMRLEKTRFTTSPKEPVKINLTLTNIGDEEITLIFHYKSKFDFMIFDYSQGAYAYKWSYERIEGPPGWAADPSTYPINITLEPPEINTIILKPGEGISQTLIWDQFCKGGGGGITPQVELAPKGKYRIEGFAGFGDWPGPYSKNSQRFFEYALPDGTLVSAVLQTPGIDISLT